VDQDWANGLLCRQEIGDVTSGTGIDVSSRIDGNEIKIVVQSDGQDKTEVVAQMSDGLAGRDKETSLVSGKPIRQAVPHHPATVGIVFQNNDLKTCGHVDTVSDRAADTWTWSDWTLYVLLRRHDERFAVFAREHRVRGVGVRTGENFGLAIERQIDTEKQFRAVETDAVGLQVVGEPT
jgi:hypothetical protein